MARIRPVLRCSVHVRAGAAYGKRRAAPAVAAPGRDADGALGDGSSARQFFPRTSADIEVPLDALHAGSGSIADAARRYLGLGIEHILLGVDHLLFVFGLLLLVRGPGC